MNPNKKNSSTNTYVKIMGLEHILILKKESLNHRIRTLQSQSIKDFAD